MKFEEYEGKLFRMLDEPVPLAPDSKLPCLVRLIQDDSPMGKYNRDMNCFGVTGKILFIAQKIQENSLYRNTLHAYEKNSLNQDYCIASIHTLEVIGYPVAEGSKEWALYQIGYGNKVAKEGYGERYGSSFYENRLFYLNGCGCLVTKNGIGLIDPCSEEEFLSLDETGWQIYKEPEPKPLLADAKVGDFCQTRGEGYHLISDVYTDQRKYAYERNCGDTIYVRENGMFNLINHEHPFDIIHTEPLAPEGSAEWAVQRMKLGDKVTKRHLSHTYWQYDARPHLKCISEYNCGTLQIMVSPEIWLATAEPTGWQLYKEPELKYKVGDWVEWCGDQYMVESAPPQSGGRYDIRSPYDELGCSVYPENITRKLSPSEVIVNIGCMSGTVVFADADRFILRGIGNSEMSNACIMFKMLDTETRELVESLLKAQEEETK